MRWINKKQSRLVDCLVTQVSTICITCWENPNIFANPIQTRCHILQTEWRPHDLREKTPSQKHHHLTSSMCSVFSSLHFFSLVLILLSSNRDCLGSLALAKRQQRHEHVGEEHQSDHHQPMYIPPPFKSLPASLSSMLTPFPLRYVV